MYTWNIRGLIGKHYSKLDDIDFKNIIGGCDFISLTETWSSDIFDYSLNGYGYFILHRPKKLQAFRASGGLILYYNLKFENYISLYKTDECHLIIKFEGCLISCTNPRFVFVVYIPPATKGCYKPKVDPYVALSNNIADLLEEFGEDINVVITVDCNARTAELPDYIVSDCDLSDYMYDECSHDLDVPNPRYNADKIVNRNGEKLLDLCISTRLRIVNGRVGVKLESGKLTLTYRKKLDDNDKWNGQFTQSALLPDSNNVSSANIKESQCGSTVDYMVVSQNMFDLVHYSFKVDEDNVLSDHRPLVTVLKMNVPKIDFVPDGRKYEKAIKHLKWDKIDLNIWKSKCEEISEKIDLIVSSDQTNNDKAIQIRNILHKNGEESLILNDDGLDKGAAWMCPTCISYRKLFMDFLKYSFCIFTYNSILIL